MTETTARRFDNGYDESTTATTVLIRPTLQEILDLPLHTEIVCMWDDGAVDGYDVDQDFKDHMIDGAREQGTGLNSFSGALVIVAVKPDKMHPGIVAALLVKEGA